MPVLHEASGQLAQAIAAQAEAERRTAAEALPAELAAMRAALLAVDDEIEAQLAKTAAKCRERAELGEALARRSGVAQWKRYNDRLPARIRSAAARLFTISPGAGAVTANNNFLGVIGEFVGAAAHITLRQADEATLDDLCACYASEPEALAAKERLAARATETIVDKIGATWTLIPVHSLYANRNDAEQFVTSTRRTGAEYVIRARGPGFIVMPAPLAESAAALEALQPPAAA